MMHSLHLLWHNATTMGPLDPHPETISEQLIAGDFQEAAQQGHEPQRL